jgi:putative N6-adenine-specific DNA methylase
MQFFATAARGTEGALRDELRELGVREVRADRGGVHFGGDWSEGFRVCFESRIAMRVLTPLGDFEAPTGDALYEGVKAIDWAPWLTARHTLAVSASCRSSALTHTAFIAQRTKDGIVDPLRERTGQRPSVDREDPDVHVFVHLVKDHATVYLDLAGEPLHRRGYRVEGAEAPLKETLAAAILRLSGWDRKSPLLDPMCGSGTLILEAALWAAGVPGGVLRETFGFERWAAHGAREQQIMRDLRQQARERPIKSRPFLLGSDADAATIELARRCAATAGVRVTLVLRPLAEVEPLRGRGFVITNPPYGMRLDLGPERVRDIVAATRKMRGHQVAILTMNDEISRAMPFRPDHVHQLFNGDLECRLIVYSVR